MKTIKKYLPYAVLLLSINLGVLVFQQLESIIQNTYSPLPNVTIKFLVISASLALIFGALLTIYLLRTFSNHMFTVRISILTVIVFQFFIFSCFAIKILLK